MEAFSLDEKIGIEDNEDIKRQVADMVAKLFVVTNVSLGPLEDVKVIGWRENIFQKFFDILDGGGEDSKNMLVLLGEIEEQTAKIEDDTGSPRLRQKIAIARRKTKQKLEKLLGINLSFQEDLMGRSKFKIVDLSADEEEEKNIRILQDDIIEMLRLIGINFFDENIRKVNNFDVLAGLSEKVETVTLMIENVNGGDSDEKLKIKNKLINFLEKALS